MIVFYHDLPGLIYLTPGNHQIKRKNVGKLGRVPLAVGSLNVPFCN